MNKRLFSISSYGMLLLVISAVVVLSLFSITPLDSLDTEESTPVTSSQTENSTSSDTQETGSDGGDSNSRNALQNGLQAHYRFDSPQVSRGNSLEFDGNDDFVEVSDDESLDIADEITMSAWVKQTNLRDVNDRILMKPDQNSRPYGMWGLRTGLGSYFRFAISIDGDRYDLDSPDAVEEGVWTLWTAKYNGSMMELYKNGYSVNTNDALSGSIDINNEDICLAANCGTSDGSENLEGQIDDVRVYNRSLSDSEVEDLYNERPVSGEGLVLHKDFNEGPDSCDLTSNTACLTDDSGNSNAGTPNGFDDNSFNSGSGWFNQMPLNRPSLEDSSGRANTAHFYGGNNGELENFDFNENSGWTEGVEGDSALEFDGGSTYVDLGFDDVPDQITLSAWVNSEDVGSDFQSIVGKYRGDESTESYEMLLNDQGGVRFHTSDDRIDTNHEDLEDDTWYHVVSTWDGSTAEIYVNGELDRSGTGLTHRDNTVPWNIGRSVRGTNYFNGTIDNVRIYDRPITSTEVESLYHGEKVREGLVGEWRFEEGEGENAYDTSAAGREGILGTESLRFKGEKGSVETGSVDIDQEVSAGAWVDVEDSQVFGSDHGRFEMPSGSGEVFVNTGLDTDVIRLRSTPTNAQFDANVDEGGDEYGWSQGLVVNKSSGIEQMVMADGSGSSSTNDYTSRSADNLSIIVVHAGPAGDDEPEYTEAEVTKINSTGFTVDFKDVVEQNYVTYTAYDFPESTRYDLGNFKTPENSGIKSVSGPGFKPNYLEMYTKPELDNMTDRIEVRGDDFGWNFGMAAENENNRMDQQTLGHTGYANNQDSHVWASNTSEILHTLYKQNSGPVDGRVQAQLEKFTDNGFDLDYGEVDVDDSSATEGQPPVMYLAVQTGLEKDVGAARTPEDTGNQRLETDSNMESINFWGTNTVPELEDEGYSGDNQGDNHWGYMFGAVNKGAENQQSMGFSSHSDSMNGHASNSNSSAGIEILYADKSGNIIGKDNAFVTDIAGREINLNWNQIQTAESEVSLNRTVFMYSGFGEPNTVIGGNESSFSLNTRDGEIKSYVNNSLLRHNLPDRYANVYTTYDGNTQKLYIDGKLVAQKQTNSALSRQKLDIGKGYRGLIDEARVYNRTLSQNEVERTTFQ